MKAAEMFKVEGYGAIVTGGASGLGLCFVEVLAENGARVTMLDIDPAGIDPGPRFITFDRKTRPPDAAIEHYTDERWDHVIDTNLNSVFTTIKAAAKHMKPRKSGRIIVTTSVAALVIEGASRAAYMAAKAGAAHLMRNAALEL